MKTIIASFVLCFFGLLFIADLGHAQKTKPNQQCQQEETLDLIEQLSRLASDAITYFAEERGGAWVGMCPDTRKFLADSEAYVEKIKKLMKEECQDARSSAFQMLRVYREQISQLSECLHNYDI